MFHVSFRQQEAPDLFEWLCIEELRLCCPPGQFGPDCKGVKYFKNIQGFRLRPNWLQMWPFFESKVWGKISPAAHAWCSGCCDTSLVYVLNSPLPTCTFLGCAFITFVHAVMMKTINPLYPRRDEAIYSWLFIKHNKKRDVFSPAQVFDYHSLCHTVSRHSDASVNTANFTTWVLLW